MRILFITSQYPPQFSGGYELRCQETAHGIKQRGYEVVVLSSRWKSRAASVENDVYRRLLFDFPDETKYSQRHPMPRWIQRYHEILSAFYNLRNYAITTEVLDEVQPNLVFIWNLEGMGVSPILASQDHGIPVVISIGDYWLVNWMRTLLNRSNPFKRIYRAAILGLADPNRLNRTHLLVVSNKVKQTYVKGGFSEKNVIIIPRGIPSERILPDSKLDDLPAASCDQARFLFLGRLVKEKGPDSAIIALGILKRRYQATNLRLDIVGNGPPAYLSRLKELVSEWDLEDQINFLGELDHSQVWDLFLRYNAMLFPYRWDEPFGGVILEAMARGLPVILTKRGGPLEYIRDGVNGLFVTRDDPEEWAETIHHFLAMDAKTIKNMRVSALTTIKEKYTFESVVDQTLSYFQYILK